ncbi:hypothetical protein EHEL_031410 [Encephalitozoon hellem ATCC 50504]|uniref:Uncharacterized protein n=1 Tax=Encephalitozoon hellem TaxID=27973 RepID=A0A9Q9C2D9_ENCHE|nr:uncharacterized protein EHEL_031410 [Encephalitozoon hellem ATCC 50504]AFM98036.1 hypothetical protein EHEL_031410 [Encephalitozoon hellem ATCC 50504]UTX42841.1 hypothetical protein GPU96_03g05650 [Encephalitozoon hellem]|eukprot:XP_003887017.1 hypothetical protein EHEL_031410 [Encephalitozoon hellem ATCC 50504]
MKNQCHILPFFAPEVSKVEVEHVNLDGNEATIRGISCIKKRLDSDLGVYTCNKIIKDPVFYWVPANSGSAFEKGLELVRKGLGFPGRNGHGPLDGVITRKNKKIKL